MNNTRSLLSADKQEAPIRTMAPSFEPTNANIYLTLPPPPIKKKTKKNAWRSYFMMGPPMWGAECLMHIKTYNAHIYLSWAQHRITHVPSQPWEHIRTSGSGRLAWIFQCQSSSDVTRLIQVTSALITLHYITITITRGAQRGGGHWLMFLTSTLVDASVFVILGICRDK